MRDAMPERGPVRAAKQWHSMPLGYSCMLPRTSTVSTICTFSIHTADTCRTDTQPFARTVSIIPLVEFVVLGDYTHSLLSSTSTSRHDAVAKLYTLWGIKLHHFILAITSSKPFAVK